MIEYKKYRVFVEVYPEDKRKYRAQYLSGWWIFSSWNDINESGSSDSMWIKRCDSEKEAKARIKKHIGEQVVSKEIEPFTKLDLLAEEEKSTSTTGTTTRNPYNIGMNHHDLAELAKYHNKHFGPGAKSIK